MTGSTNCEDCRFWCEGYEPGYGECRRRAPAMIQGQFEPTIKDGTVPQRDAIWPETAAESWCGEAVPAEGTFGPSETPGSTRAHGDSRPPHSTVEPTPQSGAIPDGPADGSQTSAEDIQSVGPTPEGAIVSERKANEERTLQPNPEKCRHA